MNALKILSGEIHMGRMNLAKCFQNGEGVIINLEKVSSWYMIALENGNEVVKVCKNYMVRLL